MKDRQTGDRQPISEPDRDHNEMPDDEMAHIAAAVGALGDECAPQPGGREATRS